MLITGTKPAELTEDGNLKCPKCGQQQLHHSSLSVFNRNEDSPTVAITHVLPVGIATIEAQSHQSENPSPRRNGIKIAFTCELCDDPNSERYLNVVQHKGETFIYWDAG